MHHGRRPCLRDESIGASSNRVIAIGGGVLIDGGADRSALLAGVAEARISSLVVVTGESGHPWQLRIAVAVERRAGRGAADEVSG
jgi:hypothetical protein